jgi:hypothetical protein
MCRRLAPSIVLAAALGTAAALPLAALAAPAPQSLAPADGDDGWQLTGLAGGGLSFYYGDQVADPAFGFSAGKFLSDSMQVEGQLLAIRGPVREQTRENHYYDELYSISWSREQTQSYMALTRVNLYLGHSSVRPYLAFGVGLGWGSERDEWRDTCVSPRCSEDGYSGYRHNHEQQGIALATLLGTGVDVGIGDRWRLRPEIVTPFMWGAPQAGYVTLAVGITYTTRPVPTARRSPLRSSAHAGEPLSVAWQRVAAVPLGEPLRVQVRRDTSGVRDGRYESVGSTLMGSFVAADDSALVMRVTQGAKQGTWRIPRTRVLRIERGRLERNGAGEGVLGGFVAGAMTGAVMYLGSGGGDDHEIFVPAMTMLVGGPAALIGGVTDYLHKSFESTDLIYDARLVVAG